LFGAARHVNAVTVPGSVPGIGTLFAARVLGL
jgi:hypothetical protein